MGGTGDFVKFVKLNHQEVVLVLYLSQWYRDVRGIGCPIAAHCGEVARTDQAARRVVTEGVESRIALLRDGKNGKGLSRSDAIRQLVEMVGAVVVARTIERLISDEMLTSVREVEDQRRQEEAGDGLT